VDSVTKFTVLLVAAFLVLVFVSSLVHREQTSEVPEPTVTSVVTLVKESATTSLNRATTVINQSVVSTATVTTTLTVTTTTTVTAYATTVVYKSAKCSCTCTNATLTKVVTRSVVSTVQVTVTRPSTLIVTKTVTVTACASPETRDVGCGTFTVSKPVKCVRGVAIVPVTSTEVNTVSIGDFSTTYTVTVTGAATITCPPARIVSKGVIEGCAVLK